MTFLQKSKKYIVWSPGYAW